MILDEQLLFSDAQAVTATAVSTNVIDLGIERRIGSGKPLFIVVSVQTALTDVGSDSTVTVTVETDTDDTFPSATVAQTLGTFAALAVAGIAIIAPIQPNLLTENIVRLRYTVAGGDLSTGSFDAFIVEGTDTFQSYADAVTIS